ncbi:S8 family serine peptidase [Tautonia sp. JC769]|uniref:S8 family serine peptidase n=1 Tax=Tautonia sp. JC769 TaxID=3232135 RepID=UPI0034591E2B
MVSRTFRLLMASSLAFNLILLAALGVFWGIKGQPAAPPDPPDDVAGPRPSGELEREVVRLRAMIRELEAASSEASDVGLNMDWPEDDVEGAPGGDADSLKAIIASASGGLDQITLSTPGESGLRSGDNLPVYRPGETMEYLGRLEIARVAGEQMFAMADSDFGMREFRPGDVATPVLPTPALREADRIAQLSAAATPLPFTMSPGPDVGEDELKILPGLLAVEGDRVSVRTGGGRRPVDGVIGYADNLVPMSAPFADQGIYFLQVKPGSEPELQDELSRSGEVRQVGLVAQLGPATSEASERSTVVIPPEFIVRFRAGVGRDRIDEINREHGVVVVQEDPSFENQFLLRPVEPSPKRMLELTRIYADLEEYGGLVTPNFIYPRSNRLNEIDPLMLAQWHLENRPPAEGGERADLRAKEAWQKWEHGEGRDEVVVAVLDMHGVQYNHPDLVNNLVVNEAERLGRLGVDDDENSYTDDIYGWNFSTKAADPTSRNAHGTAVAGVVAAEKGNGIGGCGVAPGCSILPIHMGQNSFEDAAAFNYAVDRGASVIVCSWGYGGNARLNPLIISAVKRAVTEGRGRKGAVVVFALSNEHRDNYKANRTELVGLPGVIAAGRSTNWDQWGRCGFGGENILLAPSGSALGSADDGCVADELNGTLEIVTTDLTGPAGYNGGMSGPDGSGSECRCNPNATEIEDPNYTSCFHGTSASAPMIAGVAALVLSAEPRLTAAEVRSILFESADRIEPGEAGYEPNADGLRYSPTHGHGRINAEAAVELALRKKAELDAADAPGPDGAPPASGEQAVGGLPADQELNRPGDPHTLPFGEEALTVFSPRNLWALVLTPDADRARVLETLGDRARPVREKWAEALDRSRGVLILGGSVEKWAEVERIARPAIDAGLAQSLGRVIFLEPDDPDSAVVLTGSFGIYLAPSATEGQLRDFGRDLGFKVDPCPFDPERFILRPATTTSDPLEMLGVCKKIEEVGLVDPRQTVPDWIVPVEQRL